MFNVAEAIVRVFHRLGDYKHKQRNRMKFLIKSLGWDGFRRSSTRSSRRSARGRRAAAVRSRASAGRRAPRLARAAAGRPPIRSRARRGGRAARGPASSRASRPVLAHRRARARAGATNVRPQKQPGYAIVTWSRRRSATSPRRRCGCSPSCARASATARARHARAEPGVPLGAERRGAALYAGSRRRPRPRRRRHARRRHQLPGRRVVPARGDAVARPRPLLGDQPARARPTWSRRARTDIKISGCPNGCGQHHIAGIGFQGSLRKVGGKAGAAVLRDGRRRRGTASRPSAGTARGAGAGGLGARAPRVVVQQRGAGGGGAGGPPPAGGRPCASRRSSPISRSSRPKPRPSRTSSTWPKTMPSTRK